MLHPGYVLPILSCHGSAFKCVSMYYYTKYLLHVKENLLFSLHSIHKFRVSTVEISLSLIRELLLFLKLRELNSISTTPNSQCALFFVN